MNKTTKNPIFLKNNHGNAKLQILKEKKPVDSNEGHNDEKYHILIRKIS